jgi:hypothetical protein
MSEIITMPHPIPDPRTSPEARPLRIALLKLLHEFDASIVSFGFDLDETGKIESIYVDRAPKAAGKKGA